MTSFLKIATAKGIIATFTPFWAMTICLFGFVSNSKWLTIRTKKRPCKFLAKTHTSSMDFAAKVAPPALKLV